MNYKLIFFDADDTLFNHTQCAENAFFETLDYFSSINPKNYSFIYEEFETINNNLWTSFRKGEIKKEILLIHRFKLLFDKLELPINPNIFNESYLANLAQQNILFPNVVSTIKKLHKQCKLAIISNGVAKIQNIRLNSSELKHYIYDIFISDNFENTLNFQKPNPQIFRYAHYKIAPDIPIDKILMVGDKLTSDIKGGNNYGIDTCWFNPEHRANRSNIIPSYTICNFNELLAII